MAFQLFKISETESQNTVNDPKSENQNIVYNPEPEKEAIQYNPLLIQNKTSLDQVQISNFEKSYGEEVLEETIPNTNVKQSIKIKTSQTQETPKIDNNAINPISNMAPPISQPMFQTMPQPNQQPVIETRKAQNKKRLFPLPNTVPIKTFPKAPEYKVETPNYQVVSTVGVPAQTDFNVAASQPIITTPNVVSITNQVPIVENVPVAQIPSELPIEEPKPVEEKINLVEPSVEKLIANDNLINETPKIFEDKNSISSVLPSQEENVLLVDENIFKTVDNTKDVKSIFTPEVEPEIPNYNPVDFSGEESNTINQMVSNLLNQNKEEINNTNEVTLPTDNSVSVEEDIDSTKDLDVKIDNFSNLSNEEMLNINTEPVEEGFRRCPKCGQKMREDYRQCFVCGTYF